MFNQIFGEEYAKKISKLMIASLALLSLFLLVKVITDLKRLPRVGNEIYPQSTIVATGEGESYAIPDIASFSFTVTETAEGVQDAQTMATAKIDKALAMLKEAGIDEKDIKTTDYSVYPKYEWSQPVCAYGMMCPQGKNKLIGYESSQTILVKVRDTKKAGELVGKIGAVNVSNVSGVEFTVDNKDQYVAEARAEAITKAKEHAKVLAKQLGVKLGNVMYINEGGNYMPGYYGMDSSAGMGGAMMEKSVAPVPASLPSGQSKITSSVSITYEIK